MQLSMTVRRSMIEAALAEMITRKKIRVTKPAAPAEDCEFPEEEEQNFPEYEPDEGYESDAYTEEGT